MITTLIGTWQAKKWLPMAVGVIVVTILLTALTAGIKSYAQSKITIEEQRRKDEINTAIQQAIDESKVKELQTQFQILTQQLEQEKLERQRVDQELQELRTSTEKTIQRIQRRQSQLASLLLEKPVETAAELSNEYNDLNRSLK